MEQPKQSTTGSKKKKKILVTIINSTIIITGHFWAESSEKGTCEDLANMDRIEAQNNTIQYCIEPQYEICPYLLVLKLRAQIQHS